MGKVKGTTKIKSGLAHCYYHDSHWGWCGDYNERVEYIKINKPSDEVPLRLKLFQLVPKDRIPGRESPEWIAFVKAGEARAKAGEVYAKAGEAYPKASIADYDKAWEAYDKAWEAFVKTGEAFYKTWEAYYNKRQGELEQLHTELFPDCPWNGYSIFPNKGVN